ncbi:hypothetical protein PoB_004739900 [Plakobranchus ocellatus]|uniref:Uncharacterized protein n=1 Tax=Plakobranchus ocellatus TaxID=259542 RepID=A0AAV4BRB9_9GAST|nr:hypothetical protein PoB_004739900 [Plakobranchus ocellatus]
MNVGSSLPASCNGIWKKSDAASRVEKMVDPAIFGAMSSRLGSRHSGLFTATIWSCTYSHLYHWHYGSALVCWFCDWLDYSWLLNRVQILTNFFLLWEWHSPGACTLYGLAPCLRWICIVSVFMRPVVPNTSYMFLVVSDTSPIMTAAFLVSRLLHKLFFTKTTLNL